MLLWGGRIAAAQAGPGAGEASAPPVLLTQAGEPAPAGPVVLLGVFANERSDRSLRDSVLDRLTRLGEEVSATPDSADHATCKQTSCYAEISARIGAKRLLRVDIYESSPRRYYLEGSLFETASGSIRSAKGSCDDCSGENLRTVLSDLAARILSVREPAPRHASPESTPSARTPPWMPAVESGARSRPAPPSGWTPPRIALVTVLSTLTATMLIGTVVIGTRPIPSGGSRSLCVTDGTRPSNPEFFPCASQPLWIAGASVLTGLSAAGLGLSLYPALRHNEKSL